MSTQKEVFEAIAHEREYQDGLHGNLDSHDHNMCEWLVILDKKINDAKLAWYNEGDSSALGEILKIASTGVACLEQHRIVRTR